jgi:hypothetical protein
LLLVLIMAAPLALVGLLPFLAWSDSSGGLAVGEPAPALVAAGWVNGEPPADLAGKIVVIEAWAPW